jgi:hypothetical protein
MSTGQKTVISSLHPEKCVSAGRIGSEFFPSSEKVNENGKNHKADDKKET